MRSPRLTFSAWTQGGRVLFLSWLCQERDLILSSSEGWRWEGLKDFCFPWGSSIISYAMENKLYNNF